MISKKKKKKKKKKKRSSPKFRVNFRPKSKIQTFFLPKIRWSPKKKKKTFSASKKIKKIRKIFRPKSKIQTFFPLKIMWSQKKKKKKGLRQNSGQFFFQFRNFKRLRGGSFRMGGLFSIFHRKSASKAQKTCDFAYFTSPSPPAPPLATLLIVDSAELEREQEVLIELDDFDDCIVEKENADFSTDWWSSYLSLW